MSNRPRPALSSRTAAVTFAAFAVIGWTFVTHRSWLRGGVEMLAVGLLAAGVAYGAGMFLSGVA